MKRTFAIIAAAVLASAYLGGQARAPQTVQAPSFEVAPFWPKPLPNHWLLGSVTGVAVDAQDNIWIVHQGASSLNARTEMGAATTPPTAESCCVPAPPVLKFDSAGNLLGSWGGPGDGYAWPRSPQGIAVDAKGNVWIGGVATGTVEGPAGPAPEGDAPARGAVAARGRGAAPAPRDAQLLKFSNAGKFLLQIGMPGKTEGVDSKTTLNAAANIEFDSAANEVYVADRGNRRVVVFDADTGAYKRHWGAYGTKPDETALGTYGPAAAPAKQLRGASCVRIARDGLVYVCDREGDRIQVFQKDGKFVKESVVSKATLGDGAVWDIAFSKDAQQRYLYVADGHDKKVLVLQRDPLDTLTSFGMGGRQPGQFFGVGNIAVDSKGNVYTGETFEGKRVQKFEYKGLKNVAR
jgi:sugar lactone lactonase YvrE